ncbi:MAG: HlyC/CorC family transporter [Alphaproteobacteria bacterium]|nr:HlyC/CorC family transporter [Alphaproteobacteria bacterium]
MQEYSLISLLIFQLFLIFLNAVFACTEIAVISMNDSKLKKMAEDGHKRAKKLLSLTLEPAGFLATIQVGITLAGFLGSAFAADNFSDRIVAFLMDLGLTISPQKLDVIAVIFITIILSYVTLILGELVPKRIGMQYSEKIALLMAYPIYGIAKIFAPIVWFLTFSTNLTLRLFGIKENKIENNVTEEEIRMLIDIGTQNGTIDMQEKSLIHNVFEFDDKLVSDVLTHRMHVKFINIDEPVNTWETKMLKSRFSVYPVYKKNHDNIIGTIKFKDFFKEKGLKKEELIKKILNPVQFIPEGLKINDVFKSMQKSRNHFAVTVDEYGAMTGIITISDLLEEIVGSLNDDSSAPIEEPEIKQISKNEWEIQGVTLIEKVEKLLKLQFPPEDYSTLGGFILSAMTTLPASMNGVKVQFENIYFEVLKANGHKIEKVLVRREALSEENESQNDNKNNK